MGTLNRTLGRGGLTVHYVSSVIGVSVLVLPGIAYSIAGPASILAWLFLVLFSYPLALIFARMSMRFPNSRGVADFIEQAFGRKVAARASLFFLVTLVVANPVLGIAAARYLGEVIGITENRNVLALGYLIILITVVLNLFGIKVSVRTQFVLLTFLIIFITGVCLLSLEHADLGAFEPFLPYGLPAVGSAVIICFFGFIGWENAAPVAEEVIDPERTFPSAILLGVVLVGIIFLLMAGTVILTLPLVPSESGAAIGATSFSRLLELAVGGKVGKLGGLIAAGLMFMTTNAWTLGVSRYLFGMAREGELPRFLASVSGVNAVPRRAIVALGFLYGTTVLALWLTDRTEIIIIDLSSSGFLLFFTIGFIAAIKILPSRFDRVLAVCLSVMTTFMLAINRTGLIFCVVVWAFVELVHVMRPKRARNTFRARPEKS